MNSQRQELPFSVFHASPILMARSDAHQSLLMSLTSEEPTSVLKCLHIYVSIPLEIGLASPDECFKNQLRPMYSRTSAAPSPGGPAEPDSYRKRGQTHRRNSQSPRESPEGARQQSPPQRTFAEPGAGPPATPGF